MLLFVVVLQADEVYGTPLATEKDSFVVVAVVDVVVVVVVVVVVGSTHADLCSAPPLLRPGWPKPGGLTLLERDIVQARGWAGPKRKKSGKTPVALKGIHVRKKPLVFQIVRAKKS